MIINVVHTKKLTSLITVVTAHILVLSDLHLVTKIQNRFFTLY
jgi:hypothetical protein